VSWTPLPLASEPVVAQPKVPLVFVPLVLVPPDPLVPAKSLGHCGHGAEAEHGG